MDSALLEAFGLDPDVLHLNHGSFGVAPVVVRRAAAAWRERAERNPHRFNRVEVSGLVVAARERAAEFLGVDPSRAAWVRNVSEGVSAVLGSLELHPGDELVISTHGYGAVRKALRHHAARAGARIVEAAFPVGAGDDAIVSAYAAACSRRTRLVVIDRITSPTATVLPVAAVSAAVAAAVAAAVSGASPAPGPRCWSTPRTRPASFPTTSRPSAPTTGSATCTSGRTPLGAAQSCGVGREPA